MFSPFLVLFVNQDYLSEATALRLCFAGMMPNLIGAIK